MIGEKQWARKDQTFLTNDNSTVEKNKIVQQKKMSYEVLNGLF